MSELDDVLKLFDPISLKEMDRVKLLNRVDTKYVFDISTLIKILPEISKYYYVLEIDGKRTNSYQTLYYDTENFDSYNQHQNGKLNRTKIRFRKYIESNLNFLEIKFKNNKERTIKKRIKIADIETDLSSKSVDFINEYSFLKAEELAASLWNSFTRITLTHKTINERLTIDLNLAFKNNKTQEKTAIPHIVIAELKQGKANVGSDFVKIIKKQHVRPMGMSKYCIGTALLNKQLKSNNFKERILKINKLKHA
jgi:hypothetical protein